MSYAPVISAASALVSVACTVLSYRINRAIREEAKSDDRLVVGAPTQPGLRGRAYWRCVIQCPVFNKSKRKAFIDAVTVYDKNNEEISVIWSGEIDELGMPQNPTSILGVIDSATLCIRRVDGESFDYARILFSHSFAEVRAVIVFDPLPSLI